MNEERFAANCANKCEPKRRNRTTSSRKSRRFFLCGLWLIILFLFSLINLYAQQRAGGRDDSQPAHQYALFVQQLIDEGKWSEASAAAVRAGDFANASSDISYQIALIQFHFKHASGAVIDNLDTAIETNRWVIYNENSAFLLKTQLLIILKNYNGALIYLDAVGSRMESDAQMRADAQMLRLTALRGVALGTGYNTDLVVFRSSVLNAMDRFPRDPRPLRIFFEYANKRLPDQSNLPASDINLLELALRRLPFLLETDPELAWMAAPLIRDTDAARRLLASYRSGGIPNIQNRDFMPHPGSIPAALNLGLIDDRTAVEELFSGSIAFNNPVPPEIISINNNGQILAYGNPVIDKNIISGVYRMLRSEEGRALFTQKLLLFTGFIYTDDERDGYAENIVYYREGSVNFLIHYHIHDNISSIIINFNFNNVPEKISISLTGQSSRRVELFWERYPSVIQAKLGNETFLFAPVDFQYAPVALAWLGGSNAYDGVLYPSISNHYFEITYRTLVSFCSSLIRPSLEFDNAFETIQMSRGVIQNVTEELNGTRISVTEFQRGLPSVQYIDLDLDGRMETIRSFRRPPAGYVWQDLFDYRRLLSSSESDFRGDGRFKTMEVYQLDGSVVYYYDLDGSGEMNYSEIRYKND